MTYILTDFKMKFLLAQINFLEQEKVASLQNPGFLNVLIHEGVVRYEGTLIYPRLCITKLIYRGHPFRDEEVLQHIQDFSENFGQNFGFTYTFYTFSLLLQLKIGRSQPA